MKTVLALFSVILLFITEIVCREVTFQNVLFISKLQNNEQGEPELQLKVQGHVPTINQDIFKYFNELVLVNISNTKVEEIRPGAFENIPKLNYIECNNNNLNIIRSKAFANLTVDEIQLKNNSIKVLEEGAFKNLIIHTELNLAGNKLKEIRKNVFDNISVYYLDLSNNSISKLEVGVFAKIDHDENFSGIQVNLENNKLEELNPDVFNQDIIIALQLDNNLLTRIRPGALKNLPNLGELYLSRNNLTTIENKVFSKTQLQVLHLDHNHIASIESEAFDDMHKLVLVILNFNNLKTWDVNWFSNSFLPYGILLVTDNDFEEIPDDAFKNYPSMDAIDLRRNKIKKIASHVFKKMKRLRHLLLSDNQIEKWNQGYFEGNSDLVISGINLRRNQLKCFDGRIEDTFASVKVVWLEGNPFDEICLPKFAEYANKTKKYEIPDGYD